MFTSTIHKGLGVALVVGSILLLINQFDVLLGDAELELIPALLTYLIPFLVFVAGQHSARSNCDC